MGKIKQVHSEGLTGEHRFGDAGQATIACLFFALWITDNSFHYSTFLNQYLSPSVRIPFAIVLFALAGYMAAVGLYIVFIKKPEKRAVIRENVFRVIRHPIYLSEMVLYVGFLVLSTALAALAVCILGIGFLHYLARHEEKLLIERFGDDYRRYMKEVPMWIPFLRRK